MPRKNLTDRTVAALRIPEGGQVDVYDAKNPRFGIRLSCKGTRTWFVFDKDPRSGNRDIHYGRGHLERQIGWAREDMEGVLRDRVRSYFEGGTEVMFVQRKRGRGPFTQSSKDHEAPEGRRVDWREHFHYYDSRNEVRSGHGSVHTTLRGGWLRYEADGERLVSERPDNLEVEEVEALVRVRLGARQIRQGIERSEGYRDAIVSEREGAERSAPELQREVARQRAGLDDAEREGDEARRAEEATSDELRDIGRRIAREDARRREELRLERVLKELEHALEYRRYYLVILLELLRGDPDPYT
ncbi:MAG: hypothetical protein IIA00_09520, partial [Proteobacteria bacterium]|nr:hypothetical protein [Pseudomonadota bacterium]